ncbi:GNAT family N-acetyltransferase [Acidobacteria bacterium AB60]|nr:GNAT family N-acetyltransferase [Acidobacteria bacterium AB60]
MYRGKFIVVTGLHDVREIAPELSALRIRLGMKDDLSTEIDHLLSLNDWRSRRPVAVLFRDEQSITRAAVLLFERCVWGIPTGVLRAGDHAGDGAVIAEPHQRSEMLVRAVDVLLADWRFHSIFGAVSRPGAEPQLSMRFPGISNSVTSRIVRRRLRLGNDYEETIAGFCRRMRKTVRNKRRRFDKRTDVEVVTEMSAEQALDAMLTLASYCHPRRSEWEIRRRHDFLRNHPVEGFSHGLRLKSGQWLSLITGWRSGGVTYVPWAMHDARFRSDSLGMVINACMIEHEIARRQSAIEWVGGVTELWSQVCEPEECFCITRIRPGIRSSSIQWLSARLQRQTALGYYQNELHGDGEDELEPVEAQVPAERPRAMATVEQRLTGSLQ